MATGKPRRIFLYAVLAGLGLGLTIPAGMAQSEKTVPAQEALFTRLLDIIDKVGIIIPGEGFKSVKLGDPVEKLIRLWGQPQKTARIGRKIARSYKLSHKTIIHFLGKKNIESVLILGETGSLAHVNNGVVFGMTQEQVLAQFSSAADKRTRELIRYKSLGIAFGFKSGVLREIQVFSPKH